MSEGFLRLVAWVVASAVPYRGPLVYFEYTMTQDPILVTKDPSARLLE